MQRGSIRKRRGIWELRWYSDEIIDGQIVRRQISRKLANVSDAYRSKGQVQPLADEILARVNPGSSAQAGLSLAEFNDLHFIPHVNEKKKHSTAKFYSELFDNHLRAKVGIVRLRDFTTRHAQEVLDAIPLSHQSLLRIKTGMSAIFSYAARLGFVRGGNPVRECKAEGTRNDPQRLIYTLEEELHMLEVLGEPARSVVAVAAFTGLRLSEIRGLRWEDYTGEVLHVRRSIWRTHVGETKTPESKAVVPVIAPLRKILDLHKTRSLSKSWIFSGAKNRFSLNLDNVVAREIRPKIGNAWKGWHAFRRGLATNLFKLGVPAEVVQTILRHSSATTTRTHYIVLKAKDAGKSAMRQLEKAIKNKGQLRGRKKA